MLRQAVLTFLFAMIMVGYILGAERSVVLYHGDALDQDLTSLLLQSDPMLEVTRIPSHGCCHTDQRDDEGLETKDDWEDILFIGHDSKVFSHAI